MVRAGLLVGLIECDVFDEQERLVVQTNSQIAKVMAVCE